MNSEFSGLAVLKLNQVPNLNLAVFSFAGFATKDLASK